MLPYIHALLIYPQQGSRRSSEGLQLESAALRETRFSRWNLSGGEPEERGQQGDRSWGGARRGAGAHGDLSMQKMLRELKPDANVCPGLQQNAKRRESHANDQRSLPLGLRNPSRLSPDKGSKSKTQRFHQHGRETFARTRSPSCVMFKPSGRSHRFWLAERVEIAVQLWAACH